MQKTAIMYNTVSSSMIGQCLRHHVTNGAVSNAPQKGQTPVNTQLSTISWNRDVEPEILVMPKTLNMGKGYMVNV